MRRGLFRAGLGLEILCAGKALVTGDTPWLWVFVGIVLMVAASRVKA